MESKGQADRSTEVSLPQIRSLNFHQDQWECWFLCRNQAGLTWPTLNHCNDDQVKCCRCFGFVYKGGRKAPPEVRSKLLWDTHLPWRCLSHSSVRKICVPSNLKPHRSGQNEKSRILACVSKSSCVPALIVQYPLTSCLSLGFQHLA